MRQKKKCEGTKVDEEKQEACVKCSKLQNGRQNSFEEADTQAKQTTLSTLKSVLKRGASHKKDKLAKSSEKPVPKDMQIVGKKTKNRVQFDESQNKYFEADYVILIHEEDYDLDDYYDEGSPYDDEDDDIYDDGMAPPKICCSNPNCNNTITLSNYSQHGYHPANGLMDLNYPRGHDRDRYDFTHFYDANYDEEINQNTRKSSAITTNRCENEKCQNCNSYFDFEMRLKPDTSQDFSDQVDQVTLSPPEGYKDGGSQCCPHHGLHFHNTVNDVAQHRMTGRDIQFHEGLNQSDEEEEEDEPERYTNNEISMEDEEKSTLVDDTSSQKDDGETSLQENDKSDKLKQRFIVETITMTTVTEQRIVSEVNDDETSSKGAEESKKGGILKGGKFWKNSIDKNTEKTVNYNDSLSGSNRREEVNEANDGSTSELVEQSPSGTCSEPNQKEVSVSNSSENDAEPNAHDTASPQSTELTLTFKLGQHLLVANSLKPNSAMRQLFPSPRFVSPPPIEDVDGSESNKAIPPKQFLVTAESLKLFEEAKKSKMLGNINSKDSNQSFIAVMPPMSTGDDDLQNSGLLRTIERNTLRRSLVKYSYEYRNKRLSEKKKNENSLEERIRQLTCGIDDEEPQEEKKDEPKTEPEPSRSSPQGEESKEVEYLPHPGVQKTQEPALVPSNSSSGTGNSAYKKLTDIFSRKSNSPQVIEDINRNIKSENANLQCDLVLNSENFGNMYALNAQDQRTPFTNLKNFSQKLTATPDSKKQFLAPLTACVNPEDKERLAERYRCQPPGKESEYSLQDIEEGLRNFEPKKLGNQPDVIAETPQNETSNDELALFVQQDSGRMEKLKKRYSAADDKSDDDDDYGFNKRPLVKGVKCQYNTTTENPPPVQQAQCPPRYVCPNSKPVAATTAAAHHMSWPYYSQDGSDHKVRQQFYTIKQTDQSGNYAVYGTPQEYRTYTEVGNADYTEFKGQQKINYSVNQGQQQNIYATTNTFYRCHPVRFGGYSELSNYQFRHPPHSPPPMRRIMAASQPSPVPSDDCKIRVENRVFINRSNENYTSVTTDTSNRLKVGMPDGANVVLPPTDGMKAQETTFYRRTVPNVQNPCLQMKFSPMGYQQGVVPTASIRFSASCSPHTVTDEQNMIVDPQYATFQHPPSQNTVGVIRVEQGQQMIRVPVPYATGTPVQVHLMAGRLGRCESPQRPNSPQGAVKVPLPPYNQYLIPKGIQTGQQLLGTSTPLTVGVPLSSQPSLASQPATQSQPQPQIQSQSQPPVNPPVEIQTTDVTKTIDFEKQGKAIAEELQQRQKLVLSRSLSQETNYQSKLPPTVVAPINTMVQQERGVPEGAASSSMQDCQSTQQQQQQQQQPENGTVAPAGNTVYYTMNI